MSKVDVISGLIMRIDFNQYRNKNKKAVARLLKDLHKQMADVFVEEDGLFFDDFEKMMRSEYINPYITNNNCIDKIGVGFDNITGFSGNLVYELRWMISCISMAKDIINDFVKAREQFDDAILLNKYEDALNIVSKVEEKYGVSYWSVECKVFLSKKVDEFEEDVTKDLPDNVYGSVVLFLDCKNKESVTSDEYYYFVNRDIDEARQYSGNNRAGVEFLYYLVSGESYVYSESSVLDVIKCLQHCSIIDRFLFVERMADEVASDKSSLLNEVFKKYLGRLSEIEDDHLKALLFTYCDEHLEEMQYALKSRLNNAKTAFICGELDEAKVQVESLLKQFPNNTEAMRIMAEICILQGETVSGFEGSNLGRIIRALCSVYSIDEKRDDSIEEISKLSLLCSMSSWSRHLMSEVKGRHYNPGSDDYIRYRTIANMQHLDIETVFSTKNEDEAIGFIENNYDITDCYVSFRLAELRKDYELARTICRIKPYQDYLFICDDHSIEEKMDHLLKIEGSNASFAARAMIKFLNDICIDSYADIILKKCAELIVDNIYTGLLLPWDKIINYIDEGPSEIRKKIYVPILYYIYAYYVEHSRYDDLGIVCEDFFNFNNIRRPSEMGELVGKYDDSMLVYFLKNVCVPKTLDDSLVIFENTQERDKERVEICNLLVHIDTENMKEYEAEIREITQKLMINKELKKIDESRIHVNAEGIKEKLCNLESGSNKFSGSIKNDYQRYLFYKEENIDQWLALIKGGDAERFKESGLIARRLLNELIFRIRDAFVSSDEYGLNGYLSLNIRHNTLDDELRGPLNRTSLYVKKGSDARYYYNEEWTHNVSEKDLVILENAFGRFYDSTESILFKLKNEYIQIRTEQKNERGLFDYRLFENQIDEIAMQLQEDKTFDEFYDIVINYFWLITELNLENVKSKLRNEIYQDYLVALETLISDVKDISNVRISQRIQQKAKDAEIDMQNTINRICHWFQRSNESKHNDFSLQFAFDLGLQTIKNMHPEKKFKVVELEPTQSDKIPGVLINSFDGLFYNILDNIYKNAKPNYRDDSIEIRYKLYWSQKGHATIYIENDYDCSGDMNVELDKVQQAKELIKSGEYISKVKGEGGTGLLKIYKILVVDLKLFAKMNFGYKESENVFFLEINI